jgi:hypothetical protein
MEEFKINNKFAYITRAEDRNRIIVILPNLQELERPGNGCKYMFNCRQSVWTSRILFSWRKGNKIRGTYEDTQMDRQTGG